MKSLGLCVLGLAAVTTASTPAFANGADFALGMLGGAVGMALAQQGGQSAYPRYGYYPRHIRRAAAAASRRVAVRANVPGANLTLARDQAKVIHVFWDCRGVVATSARADRGTVSARPSTRFACGDPDHPATEIVYLSEPGAVGPDVVTYYEKGRAVRADRVFVNDSVPRAAEPPRPVRAIAGREASVWRFWNCDPSAWDVAVAARADVGSATVRTGTAAVCGRADYPVKEVFYRAADGFVGDDAVVMRSDIAAPIRLPVGVEAVAPVASAPLRVGPPASAPVAAPRPATSGAAEVASVGDGDEACGCGYLSVDGSLVRSHSHGQKVEIRYVEPAAAMAERGVKAGTVLFEGMILPDGGIGGRAYEYKAGCEAAPYAVLGRGDGTTLTLWGTKPVWQGCLATSPEHRALDQALVFSDAPAPGAGSSDPRDLKPSSLEPRPSAPTRAPLAARPTADAAASGGGEPASVGHRLEALAVATGGQAK